MKTENKKDKIQGPKNNIKQTIKNCLLNLGSIIKENNKKVLFYFLISFLLLIGLTGDWFYSIVLIIGVFSSLLINKQGLGKKSRIVFELIAYFLYSFILYKISGCGLLISMLNLYFCRFIWYTLQPQNLYKLKDIVASFLCVIGIEAVGQNIEFIKALYTQSIIISSFTHLLFFSYILIFYFIVHILRISFENKNAKWGVLFNIVLAILTFYSFILSSTSIFSFVYAGLFVVSLYITYQLYKRDKPEYLIGKNLRIQKIFTYSIYLMLTIAFIICLSLILTNPYIERFGTLSYVISMLK